MYDENGSITFSDIEKLVVGKGSTPDSVKSLLAELKARDITPVESAAKKVSENSEDMVLPPSDEIGMGSDLDSAADPEDTTVPAEDNETETDSEDEDTDTDADTETKHSKQKLKQKLMN